MFCSTLNVYPLFKKEHTMNTSRWIVSLMGMIGFAGLLAACGGEGAPSVSASGSGSGSGSGLASASGTITGFGSVIVNGRRFDTSSSSFTVLLCRDRFNRSPGTPS